MMGVEQLDKLDDTTAIVISRSASAASISRPCRCRSSLVRPRLLRLAAVTASIRHRRGVRPSARSPVHSGDQADQPADGRAMSKLRDCRAAALGVAGARPPVRRSLAAILRVAVMRSRRRSWGLHDCARRDHVHTAVSVRSRTPVRRAIRSVRAWRRRRRAGDAAHRHRRPAASRCRAVDRSSPRSIRRAMCCRRTSCGCISSSRRR